MKPLYSLVYVLLLFASTSFCHAMCTMQGIYIWPDNDTIIPNQQFMLEGYMVDEKVARSICRVYPAYLIAGDERIDLEVVKICKGQFHLTQALLRPRSSLKKGLTYQIVVENLSKEKRLTRYDRQQKKHVPVEWKVEGDPDLTPPTWKSRPFETEKHFNLYGCGPSLGVHFNVECSDPQNIRVKTQVRAIGKLKWHTYYLTATADEIVVGRGMCSGEFTLEEGEEFEVRFALVDEAGNESVEADAPIRFTRPEEMNED